jgi:hypothetical protein
MSQEPEAWIFEEESQAQGPDRSAFRSIPTSTAQMT